MFKQGTADVRSLFQHRRNATRVRTRSATVAAALLLIGSALLPGLAAAQITIQITKGKEAATPIAVIPFAFSGAGNPPADDVAEIVSADLARSGRFAPVPRADLPSRPNSLIDLDFTDWRLLKTDYIVIGELVDQGGDRYTLRFEVFDVFRGNRVLGYQFPANAANLRAAAHRASDMIFEELTGIPACEVRYWV